MFYDLKLESGNSVDSASLSATNGHAEAIRILKELGADVSAQSNFGNTPMHLAANGGHGGALRVLEELGADVSAQQNDGFTPMHFAARSRHTEAI